MRLNFDSAAICAIVKTTKLGDLKNLSDFTCMWVENLPQRAIRNSYSLFIVIRFRRRYVIVGCVRTNKSVTIVRVRLITALSELNQMLLSSPLVSQAYVHLSCPRPAKVRNTSMIETLVRRMLNENASVSRIPRSLSRQSDRRESIEFRLVPKARQACLLRTTSRGTRII